MKKVCLGVNCPIKTICKKFSDAHNVQDTIDMAFDFYLDRCENFELQNV